MPKRAKDLVKEKKEHLAYVLFYFFLTTFLIKTIFGTLAGSKCLLVSGVFALFGFFLAIVTLIRINRSHPPRRGTAYFNLDKLEFIIILGVSIIITLSTSSLLFSIGHLFFFHTLYPPEIIAAWIGVIASATNLFFIVWLKNKIKVLPELDTTEVTFVLNTDFYLSILTSFTVVVSRMGAYLFDYTVAIFMAIFLILYGISFLFKAFKGLMDASADAKTISTIEGLIKNANPDVILKTLRVNQVGHLLEIVAILSLEGGIPIAQAALIVENVKVMLKKKFQKPHEICVGFTQQDQ